MTVSQPRRRLLVVDDHETVCAGLARQLRRLYDVDTRSSATDALALIREGAKYDLILCDLVMPGMSGLDLLDAVEAEAPNVAKRIALMSASETAGDPERFRRKGVVFLYKPFSAYLLMTIVGELLSRADQATPNP